MNIGTDQALTAQEVADLRANCGWDHDINEWETCLEQNLLNVSARNDDGEVVGVGFLSGNQRHAEIVDLVVHPDYRKQGIGRKIFRILTTHALDSGIKYLGLTYSTESPWLKDFYASEGFEQIDFAMWHKSSIERV